MINNKLFSVVFNDRLSNYKPNKKNCGIVIGDVGLILSLAQLYDYTRKEYYLNKMYQILDEIMSEEKYDYSLGYGVAGLAWGISLFDEKLIEGKDEWLAEVNPVLETEYMMMINQGNIDYFKGATGILFYFLSYLNNNRDINNMIHIYINHIESKLEKNDWFEIERTESGQYSKCLNLGTPHGLSGILLFLLLIKEKGFSVKKSLCVSVLETIMQYKFEDVEKSGCYFPSKVYENGQKSRTGLAWCYGDIMVAYGVLKIGKLFDDESYISKAKLWLKNILNRKELIFHSENLILCHGYPSLSVILSEIYKNTKDDIYLEYAEKYKTKSLTAIYQDYIKYKNDNFAKYLFEEPSLLIGYSGFILTSLYWNGVNNNWTKCLLL